MPRRRRPAGLRSGARGLLLVALAATAVWAPAPARAALDPEVVNALGEAGSEAKIAAVRKLALSADPAAVPVLEALAEGTLQQSAGHVFVLRGDGAVDAIDGSSIGPVPADAEGITANNRVRREVEAALAALRLLDAAVERRLEAAQELASGADPALAPLLARALEKERDPRVRTILARTVAQSTLARGDAAARLAAVKILAGQADAATRSLLAARLDPALEQDAGVRAEVKRALDRIDLRLSAGALLASVFSGLSLGSILLLAALGLAITFGVMGVINMAHGELLMIGAYTAFAVQSAFQRFLPGAIDLYLAAAVPLAFVVAALVGMAIERTVIRFLYGRPLETLLATWGVSLFLVQATRTAFGPQNVQVSNPSWMSGGVEPLPGAVLPWNRVVIVAFAMAVVAAVAILMRRTRLGMLMRAVTQNRAMSGCMGVRTHRVDMLAFGMGAGIAGVGGVALSQIANVGPEMGGAYIVDSFMAVVLGGVGQLAGTVLASLGVGVLSKTLEGWAGAVVAKILVLAFVVLFIQKRPQGLFAEKGRTVEG